MSTIDFLKYLPAASLPFLKKWFGSNSIHIHLKKSRASKLGDYRKCKNRSHKITLNSNMPPDLLFFVLTHELAHLISFEKYGSRISPHGVEWKQTFSEMLKESVSVYNRDLQNIILSFAQSPKANFMCSENLVRYFYYKSENDPLVFVENLKVEDVFYYRKIAYKILCKRKKNYLCKQVESGKEYLFKPLVKVEKCNE